ncbi:iron-sulfur cluster carrier protein ApbC [Aeromonas sp. HMWF036]|uniref:iron-sulfur cluster carrier protein ApbC n=1 Tax=unclassified Aeromonas TaxID=257493 RepID=UPI000D33EC26|nr:MULTISPECIES: iron-sulfur cluster carrier protein ApbC [unclassified Aeromonas]PTS75097.1 iron-sulfur cluster carrier protein ApbC [Aeromonas sp. HMWF036]PTT26131.1 iron-sulfur cluster carrier protein ApbC [Aeromonas sp. HMWF017]
MVIDSVKQILAEFKPAGWHKDLVDAGFVREMINQGQGLTIRLVLPFAGLSLLDQLKENYDARLRSATGAARIDWALEIDVASMPRAQGLNAVQGIRNIIVVASGKGGVGKSTTAVNLALALQKEGARVAILDADIYGPSIPTMMGTLKERPVSHDGKLMEPVMACGLKSNSIGYLVSEQDATIWRGPMASKALAQILHETRWGEVDYLVVDMPPGTGDIQLTMAQQVPTSAAVIVTTPQDVALADARKGIAMFNKVNVPVLGIIENMSYHVCSACGHHEPLFGTGGGQKMAEQYQVALLGQLPLHIDIRQHMDDGCPTVFGAPEGSLAQAYLKLARRVGAELFFSAKPIATPLYAMALDE